MTALRPLRTIEVPTCPACGGVGPVVHDEVLDTVGTTPGTWSFRECDRCRSLWLDPRPTDEDLPSAYETYYTHQKSARPPGGAMAKRLLHRLPWHADLNAEQTLCPPHEGARVLDLGSGDGRVSRLLQAAGWQVTAVDPDPRSVAQARASGVTDARVGGLEAVGSDPPFDAIVIVHVLEHVTDPVRWLATVRSLLVPESGRLLVVTPDADSPSRQRFGSSWRGLEAPRHLQVFSAEGLRHAVAGAGFSPVDVTRSARGANWAWRESRKGTDRQRRTTRILSFATAELWQARTSIGVRSGRLGGEELIARAGAQPARAHSADDDST